MTLLANSIQNDLVLRNTPAAIESHKYQKNREWEKRQKGYKAFWLRIDNVARVQKARVRRELRTSMEWQNLSLRDQQQREMDAFSRIEQERKEKKARAKAIYEDLE